MSSGVVMYLLFAFLLIWFFAFTTYFFLKKKAKKNLQKIKASWGKPKVENRNYNLIENFATLNTNIPFYTLSTQTINDIDLHDVFAYIDRTNCKPGQQYLFNKLLNPTNNIVALQKFDDQVNFFTTNKQAREDTQLMLLPLNNYDAYFITNLLDAEILHHPKWSVLFLLDTILVIAMLVLSIKFKVLLLWLMLPFAINMVLYFRFKSTKDKFNKSFPQLNILINIVKIFIKKDLPFAKINLVQSINKLSSFQKRFRLLNYTETPKDDLSQIFAFIIDGIKAIFLIEIHSFFSCLKQLKNKKNDIINLFNYIGNIDAALSTASLRAGITNYCVPSFIEDKKEFCAKNLCHPLINNCVANSILIKDKSILITGSNMSGKSTFIRTVAINSILAQTIYTCFADEFTLPILKVFSSIRITDNLLDAKSYYFEEVNAIGSLIKESDKPFQHLFILDEVFKGTNTLERVAGAKAILSYLNKNNNIVFVSTHDIELAELLKTEFNLYHFAEDIDSNKLVFDYQLKNGALKTTNAIKILALNNYPQQIITEAISIANIN